jgi:type 1 fimbria pilin
MIAKVVAVVCAVVLAMVGMAKYAGASDSGAVTVKGYVLDSACAFTKDLKKPISKECAVACAKAGSALVILAEDGTIYWPIADTTPSSGQNTKLLPFAGEKVTASGKVYDRGGSKALVIVKIEAQK